MQEITTKNAVLPKGHVKPNDPITVYATDKAKFIPAGQPFEAHAELAKKLIASGKATDKAPKGKESKEEKAD